MKCPFCNEETNGEDICKMCGEKLSIFYKAHDASNVFYNKGLEKAKVHDLSGAIYELKKSLKLNKRNTKARNLLGLVYYEMGEIVNGLSEWVVSKHFDSDNKLASMYLKDIQASPAKIDNYNQSFKKYNLALESIKQKNEDLALIHLKKVISLNPHYVKAMQLLALVYIRQQENEKAKRILNRAKKIDVTNTTTLRYLEQVSEQEENIENIGYDGVETGRITPFNFGNIDAVKEERPNVMAFVNLIIGIVIGIVVVAFLVVPTVKEKETKKYNQAIVEESSQSSVSSTNTRNLKSTNESLKKQLEQKEKELKDMNTKAGNMKVYDGLFVASKCVMDGDKEKAGVELKKVNSKKFDSDDAKALYSYLKKEVFSDQIKQYAQEGKDLCNSNMAQEAVDVLKKAYEIADENDEDYDKILYFLGRSYHKLDKKKDAEKYYNMLIKKCPKSERVIMTKTRLKELKSGI